MDPGRLRRGRALVKEVVEIGNRQYRIGTYYIDLNEGDPCYCDDAMRSMPEPVACKHVIACMLYERGH